MIVAALTVHEVATEDARLQAELLVEADLRGYHSHGLQRLPVLVEQVRAGLAAARSEPRASWVAPAVLVVDGGRGLGPAVATFTLDALCERAATTGAALGLVSNCNHLGMLGWYAERAALAGCLTLATTTSEALVHAPGGRSAVVGTNPIAIGIPLPSGSFVLDMATGVVSMGKIIEHAIRGAALEPGWALGPDGEPTVDPGAAVDGAIAPFGGAKGFGLALALELLVASLTASAFGTAVGGTLDVTRPSTKGDVFLCVDPRASGIAPRGEALTGYLDEVRSSGLPGETLRIPGDRARSVRAQRLADGIPLDPAVWRDAVALTDGEERRAG